MKLDSELLYIWSRLENVPCAFEKNMDAIVVGWSVLYMSIESSWIIVLNPVSLLIFHLVVLSIIESGILMSPIIIVEFSTSAFNSVSFCLTYFDGLVLSV